MRQPPKTLHDFLESDFIDVRFDDNQSALVALSFSIREKFKIPKVPVPNFNAVLFVSEKQQYAELPFNTQPISMYLVWHRRNQADPDHRWFRERIQEYISEKIK